MHQEEPFVTLSHTHTHIHTHTHTPVADSLFIEWGVCTFQVFRVWCQMLLLRAMQPDGDVIRIQESEEICGPRAPRCHTPVARTIMPIPPPTALTSPCSIPLVSPFLSHWN